MTMFMFDILADSQETFPVSHASFFGPCGICFMLLLLFPTKRGVRSPEKRKQNGQRQMMLFSISNHVDAVNMMKYGDIGDLFSNNSESSK